MTGTTGLGIGWGMEGKISAVSENTVEDGRSGGGSGLSGGEGGDGFATVTAE